MLAIRAEEKGGPEVLKAVEVETPTPGAGQVLVRHAAVGLNFIDTYHRSGLYPVPFPAVLGREAAGTVEAVGDGVTRFKIGDRVAYSGSAGAYQEANVVAETGLVRVPDDIPLDLAAAALLKGMTAEFLVRRCYVLKAGDTCLIHAAAGGVGQILVQWAKAIGATIVATAGGAEKLAIAKGLGADHLIDYGTEDVAARVMEITGGKGVAVAYDAVGAATFEATLASLGRRGLFVCFGNASGPAPPFSPLRLLKNSLYMTRPTLVDYVSTPEELDESAGALFEMIASGKVKITIGQRFALKDARLAHEALESRATTGSTVLVP